MSRPSQHAAWTIIVAVAALAGVKPAEAGPLGTRLAMDKKLGVEIELDMTWSEVPTSYLPVQLIVTNRGKERPLEITSAASNYMTYGQSVRSSASTITITMPQGQSRVELPLLLMQDGPSVQTSFRVDGKTSEDLVVNHDMFGRDRYWPIFVFYGAGETAMRDLLTAVERDTVRTLSVPSVSAPRHWQCYLGLPGIVVISTGEVGVLTPEQRLALSRWVRFGGGALWLHGDRFSAAMEALELTPGEATVDGEVIRYNASSGVVITSRDIDEFLTAQLEIVHKEAAENPGYTPGTPVELQSFLVQLDNVQARTALFCAGPGAVAGLTTSSYGVGGSYADRLNRTLGTLQEKLHDVPRVGYVLISLLLAFIIGPVNLLVLMQRRKKALFYITAPSIALTGMALLFVYTLLDEGVVLKRNHMAMILHDPATGSGAVYEAHGTFGGLVAPKDPSFGVETAAVPYTAIDISGERSGSRLVTRWSPAQILSRGWISSRKHRGYVTVTPTRIRMALDVTTGDDGRVFVENGLTAMAKLVLHRTVEPDGTMTLRRAEKVQPGQKVEMKISKEPRDPAHIALVPFVDLDEMDWLVIARMEGLPHTIGQELGGELVKDNLWYLAVADRDVDVPDELKAVEGASWKKIPEPDLAEVDPESEMQVEEGATPVELEVDDGQ